jgi:predicted transcriptional regulator
MTGKENLNLRPSIILNRRQTREIRKGIAEANRGEFASDAEVRRVAKKWICRLR